MKRTIYYLALNVIILSCLVSSCKKHEYYQENPNSPSIATPALLLADILENTFAMWPMDVAYASRHMTYYERPNVYVNYNWNTGSFDAYNILRQVQDMNRLATLSDHKNYQGLAKIFRAYHFSRLTETFGDVPYSDAFKALENNVKPVYDKQEDIYVGILNELEEANNLLDPANGDILGDIIFNGDVMKWKKLANALRLRLLIHLSKKEDNTKLNITQQFQAIIADPVKYPLMESVEDNAQIVYNTTSIDNYYPLFQNNSVPSLAALEKGFVKILRDRQDPRLFAIAEPVTNMPANVFTSYEGVDAGATISDQNNASPSASKIARRYINDQVNEPMILLSYAEQEFLIAEAIARGWITGDAATHYNNGIRASMEFYDIPDSEITTYLAQPNVVYNPANAIEMIITQKYISFFLNSGWEPYFEHLRTGFPAFSTGPGTQNGGLVPKRFLYPQSEFNYNQENVTAAVQSQYGGDDSVNGTMWVLQD
jgi:Starch-binding associating with outer membrane